MSFIAELDDNRLREVRDRRHADSSNDGNDGTVTAADLYRELIDQWLAYECKRSPVLTVSEREAAVTELAVTMWRAGETFIDVAALTEVAGRALESMRGPRGLTAEQTAHLLGSGTALRRDAVGRFSFIHQSVMEYLVASDAAARLSSGDAGSDPFGTRAMSELMADFFADAYGRGCAPSPATAARCGRWRSHLHLPPKPRADSERDRRGGRAATPPASPPGAASPNLRDLFRDHGLDLRFWHTKIDLSV